MGLRKSECKGGVLMRFELTHSPTSQLGDLASYISCAATPPERGKPQGLTWPQILHRT